MMQEKKCRSQTDNSGSSFSHIIDDPVHCFVKNHVDCDIVKMLLICPSGEQRLFTFEVSNDDCTVQDLLDEAKIPIYKTLRIFMVKNPTMQFNYVAQFVPRSSLFEEGSKPNDSNLDSSQVENNGNSPMSVNKISEQTNTEANQSLKHKQETSGPSGMKRKQNHHNAESRPFDDPESLVHELSDKEDQGEGISEKSEVESNSPIVVNPDGSYKEIELDTSPEVELVVTDTNSFSSVTDFDIDDKESIKSMYNMGGGVLCEIQNMAYKSSIETSYTSFICKKIMIGSYNYSSQERVFFTQSGIKMHAPHLKDEANSVPLELKFDDIVKVLNHFEDVMPVLFLYVKVEAATMIRELLGMQDPKGPYYDPCSTDHTQKRITLLLHGMTEKSKLDFSTLCFPKKLKTLSSKEAADLLLSGSPKTIWPEIKGFIKKLEQATSKLDEFVNDDFRVIQVNKKAQSSTQISRSLLSTTNHTADRKMESVLKQSQSSLKRSRKSSSTVSNNVEGDIQTFLVYPSLPATGGITVTARDYDCLRKGQFLNDVIIDFYLKYLTLEVLSEDDQDRTHIFSIHFYNRLTSSNFPVTCNNTLILPVKPCHANVRNWTKNVNIFEKDFVIVPINEHAHWFLAIICFPGLVGKEQNQTITETYDMQKANYKYRGAKEMKLQPIAKQNHKQIKKLPCILIFDSLAGPDGDVQSVIVALREYLSCEYLAKFGNEQIFSEKTMKGSCPKVPQQSNFSDCGLYLLQYVESFFSNPITDYTLPIKTLKHWFNADIVTKKRRQLAVLIRELMKSS